MSRTVTLARPIQAHGQSVTTLTLREPTAGDLRRVKFTLGDGGVSFDVGDLLDVAARLAGVPPSALDQLTLGDVQAVVMAVLPFSVPGPRTSATP